MSESTAADPARRSILRRSWSSFIAAPAYPPSAGDLRTISVVGIEMPFRAAVAISVVTMLVLFDYSRTFIPESIRALGLAAEGLRFQALERVVLYGLVPLAVILLVFRDRPGRYGLRVGDWRWGLSLAALGMVVMTPVVMVLAALPSFQAYYSLSGAGTPELLVTHALDLVPSEFVFRGFLMFTLIRVVGGMGVLIATLPFVFAHLGKPEIETFSTLFGGMVYGWVNWRTGSIAYSAVAHVYIVTLLLVLTRS
ncbi:MAG TPA: CPBP family intramembrane glutamic endopeptidase [Vitreimonas sp.]|nr:CPBP family intramembrane glutamic endopeptidase [Vitreimonas sp.]